MMKKATLFAFALLLLSTFLSAGEPASEDAGKVAVMGSSMAAGWVTSYKGRYDMKNGYAYRLERLLAPRGFAFVHLSVPGDTTDGVQKRLERDLFPSKADYVIIGLSLANEGIEEKDPEAVCNHYEKGLKEIIRSCREEGITPIVGLCYGCNTYEEKHYRYIKAMNLLINTWDVPSINFLGAMDDGRGRFPEGYTYDPAHPDNRGHEELFLAIVPSLFQALEDGKPPPRRPEGDGFVTVKAEKKRAPFSFIPEDVIHPFAVAFHVRASSPGTIAGLRSARGEAVLEIGKSGTIEYVSHEGKKVAGRNRVTDGKWHHVVLSHRYLRGETLFYVDGQLAGTLEERLEPRQFVLGGAAENPAKKPPKTADYRDWMVFRSSLNTDEVFALLEGRLLQASLELYAPLRPEVLMQARPVANLAQSTARVKVYPSSVKADLMAIDAKLARAAKARAEEFQVAEKVPADVDPAIYDAYVGRYKSKVDGLVNTILKDKGRLYLSQEYVGKVELHPESETKFFIKFPLAEITVTFEKDRPGRANRFVLRQGEMEDVAERVK